MSPSADTILIVAGRESRMRPGVERGAPRGRVDPEDPPSLFFDASGWAYELVSAQGSTESGRLVIRRLNPSRNVKEDLRKQFGLTGRETEIVMLLGRRATNREIADALEISRHTSRHHTASVLEKLGLKSRSEVRRLLMQALTHPPRTRETKT